MPSPWPGSQRWWLARGATRRMLIPVTHRVTGLALVALLLALAASSAALAHAEPERANPPINGIVTAVPPQLEVWFTEEVEPESVQLTVRAPDGTRIDQGDAAVDLFDPERRRVTVSLGPSRGPGIYVVQWHTVSAEDGDAADGYFSFTVVAATPEASPSASPAASPPAQMAASSVSSTPEATPAMVGGGSGEANFDSRAFGLSVLAGLVAAGFIYLFWRLVRPKSPRPSV